MMFKRLLKPRPGPRVTLRDMWQISQQPHTQHQQQPRSSESGPSTRKPVQLGDHDESRNKGNVVTSDSAGTEKPVQTEKEVKQHLKSIFELTAFLKKRSTVTNSKWTTSPSKWQSSKMNQSPRLAKANFFQVKKQASKFDK